MAQTKMMSPSTEYTILYGQPVINDDAHAAAVFVPDVGPLNHHLKGLLDVGKKAKA